MVNKTINRQELISTRDYVPNDKHFILATWLKGVYYGDWYQNIPKAIFMENYRAILEKVLTSPATKIKVACLKEDPDTILGYSVYHTKRYGDNIVTVLDWVFVKAAWRSIGIGRDLIPAGVQAYTHMSKSGQAIAKQKLPNLIFNPFILF